jgi:hypothetical protein
MDGAKRSLDEGVRTGRDGSADLQWWQVFKDLHLAVARALAIVVTLGLALLATASPARAYVIEALTSIPADEAADKETLEQAIRAAIDDIAPHAVAFTPTMVSLQEAKLVGDRIYLFILLADAAGEAEIEVLKAASTQLGLDPR